MKAFPHIAKVHLLEGNTIVTEEVTSGGMELRDYFASKATEDDIREFLWGEVRSNGYISARSQIRSREEAKYAYADAMMKAREE